MKPLTIGRALGIGLRVAGRIVGRQIMGPPPQPARTRFAGAGTISGSGSRATGQAVARTTLQASRGVQQGVGGFLRPFRRVGGIVCLEVAGVFFLLFAIVFCWYLYQGWMIHLHQGGYRNVIVSGVFMVLFFYLGISSFWRANRR